MDSRFCLNSRQHLQGRLSSALSVPSLGDKGSGHNNSRLNSSSFGYRKTFYMSLSSKIQRLQLLQGIFRITFKQNLPVLCTRLRKRVSKSLCLRDQKSGRKETELSSGCPTILDLFVTQGLDDSLTHVFRKMTKVILLCLAFEI